MKYTNVIKVLKDKQYMADLLNGPCKPYTDPNMDDIADMKRRYAGFPPVNPDWIDEEATERITEAYRNLTPYEMPFFSQVLVVKNPDTILNDSAVNHWRKRTRYIVVTIIPDLEYPYVENMPLIVGMGIMSLYAWELSRAAIKASEEYAKIRLTKNPVPPILNSAHIEWVSLYIGREAYTGASSFKELVYDEDAFEMDLHFHELRQMDDPVVRKLIDAYDQDTADRSGNSGN